MPAIGPCHLPGAKGLLLKCRCLGMGCSLSSGTAPPSHRVLVPGLQHKKKCPTAPLPEAASMGSVSIPLECHLCKPAGRLWRRGVLSPAPSGSLVPKSSCREAPSSASDSQPRALCWSQAFLVGLC